MYLVHHKKAVNNRAKKDTQSFDQLKKSSISTLRKFTKNKKK
jgi:hypothetical protein